MKSTPSKILICGVNWLGDACMTMPAIQLFHQQNPATDITMLTKPALAPLWQMHPAITNTIALLKSNLGMLETIREVRRQQFSAAYIFPNSWRSALIPFAARIPLRHGRTGHYRRILLTDPMPNDKSNRHQQWEYADILDIGEIAQLPPPQLNISSAEKESIAHKIPASHTRIGILPGAARGPSKQWPKEHYIAAAKEIGNKTDSQFIILGTGGEARLCEEIAKEIGHSAISLAGKTTLAELAAALASCRTVLCNDSGGMHLAAATGTNVVAIYGLTDPTKTGPIGKQHHIIKPDGVTSSRDIPRNSPEAIRALRSIPPELVAETTLKTMLNT